MTQNFIKALITVVGIRMQLKSSYSSTIVFQKRAFIFNLLSTFSAFSIAYVFFFFALWICYRFVSEKTVDLKYERKCAAVLAILFAVFMVIGESYSLANTIYLAIWVQNGQIIKSAIKFLGYYYLFDNSLICLFYGMGRLQINHKKAKSKSRIVNWYLSQLENKPFRTAFITLSVVFLPILIIQYPAIFMGDTRNQLYQLYPELGIITPVYLKGHLINDSVYLNSHHPVLHTIFLHYSIELGAKLFHSGSAGLFIYSLIQTMIIITAISFVIDFIQKRLGLSPKLAAAAVIYYLIHPLVQDYFPLITKDVIYAAAFLAFLIGIYNVLDHCSDKRTAVFFVIALICMVLFRNEGRYVIILFAVILAVFNKNCRKQAIVIAGITILTVLLYNTILNISDVTPGSRREMLSVPFQQTARYVKEHPDEITEEEKKAIAAVLDYEHLAENYDVSMSDPVKNTFNEDATSAELKEYFIVWWKMFLKHPGSYVQATINNYYHYFYPGWKLFYLYNSKSTDPGMNSANKNFEKIGIHFQYPERLAGLRRAYEDLRLAFARIPFVAVLMIPSIYTWIFLIELIYTSAKRKQKTFWMVLIPLLVILVSLLGPCDADYGRYMYPVVVALPLISAIFYSEQRNTETQLSV